MHRGLRPPPWSIHEAFSNLQLLLAGGLYANGTAASWYSSTSTASKEDLRKEIMQIVERNNRPNVKWLNDNQVLELNV